MFPKAHAAAYVILALRIAWFKVHMPIAYYAAYFSIRAKAFDAECMIYGKEKARQKMKEIELLGNQATQKDKDMYEDLELVVEMYERGYKFLEIDLYKSHASKFLVEEGGLRPPLSSIPGLGIVAAEGIYNAAQKKTFSSIEDIKERARVGNSCIEMLRKFNCLKGIPESDQLCLFDVI